MGETYWPVVEEGKVWKCLPNIRYFTDMMQKRPEIQQLWQSSTGEIQWRQIPLVYEPEGQSNL